MKMVIADDESLVRASLCSMIKDMEAPWHIVAEATNGEELLEMVACHKPNIAIVDMRMPKLGGLEAIRLGKIISPLTEWVILSGFSDFTYAQQALKLGVSEYLLKPVDPHELEKALHHIYKDNKEYTALLNQQFENSLVALCSGLTSLKFEERDSLLHRGKFSARAFYLDSAASVRSSADIQRRCYEEIRGFMKKHLVYGMNLALLALPGGELAAVGVWDPELGPDVKTGVCEFFREIESYVFGLGSDNTAATVLSTGECQGFEEFNKRFQQLQHMADLRCVCGVNRSLDFAELSKEDERPDKAEGVRLLSAICRHFQDRMYLNYHNAVNEWETFLQKQPQFMQSEKTQESIRQYLMYAIGLHLPCQAAAGQIIRELRQHGESALIVMCPKEPNIADLVGQVTQYVEKHYMDDIGIGQIAGQLNVSANYLSTLFHKKTGMMFVKYLTRIRMLKAQELLLNTNLQVKQVAEQVGYYSTRHFTKLFTQTFGNYPSDYRKNQAQSV
ncbi:response regulator transcription factor [Paenibacillus thalictri]|uniref:Helix-turn-helix domain-containing protein n=1 Tax=Paenibacillus thalictri TaxID=2527873 RepID=A0A4Q9DGX8_9BACL|nr:helix-turn-helix domain-containing protein [Paenibacillus thalictri]TBL68591.1 helix-turn-helix domain-containing protein [Paenibacillus thalictri]